MTVARFRSLVPEQGSAAANACAVRGEGECGVISEPGHLFFDVA